MVKGRCMKEGKQVVIQDAKYDINAIGRPVVRGKCPNDGGSVTAIISLADAPKDIQDKVAKWKHDHAGESRPKKSKKSRKSKKGAASRKSKKDGGARKSATSRKSRGSRK